jgi:hypothetical protein
MVRKRITTPTDEVCLKRIFTGEICLIWLALHFSLYVILKEQSFKKFCYLMAVK